MSHEPISAPHARRRPSVWRFNLGSVLIATTFLSLGLGVFRVVPMSDEMRIAMFWLAGFWMLVAMVWLGPGWLRYARLQQDVDERKAQMQRWTDEQRARHAATVESTTEIKPPSA